MGYQWGSVNLTFRDKSQNFTTVATIYSTGLERQILTYPAMATPVAGHKEPQQ